MRSLERHRIGVRCLAVVGLAAVLAACGSSKNSPAATERAAGKANAGTAGRSKGDAGPAADMVSAVSAGKPSAAVSLKFDIAQRPEVGKPVVINIALIPGSAFARMQVIFRPSDGLDVQAGGTMEDSENPAVGVPLTHTVTVVPRSDGIFYLSAVVLAESEEGETSRTFAIPLIAGSGLPPAAATASESAARDASDQRPGTQPSQESVRR
jgi:hypothetical protein